MNRNYRNQPRGAQQRPMPHDGYLDDEQDSYSGSYGGARARRYGADQWSDDQDFAPRAGYIQDEHDDASGYGRRRAYAQQGQQFDAYPQHDAGYGDGQASQERYAHRGQDEYPRQGRRGRMQHGGRQHQEPRLAHGLPRQGSGLGRNSQWMDESMQQGYGADQGRYGYSNQAYGNQQYGSDRDLQWQDASRGYSGTGRQQSGFGGQQASRGYSGVGPKNYTRSDERIREDLCERICDAWDVDASDIDIQVRNGVATLTGTVWERAMKHRAEDLIGSVNGVKDVENQLRVSSDREQGGSMAATASANTATTASGAKAGTSTQQARAN